MIGWLIYDKEGAKRNADYIRLHQELAQEFHIELRFLLDTEVVSLLSQNIEYPDVCFVRTIHPELSKKLEEQKIQVLNPSFVSTICNDKGKTIEYIKKNSMVPTIPTQCFAREQLSIELLKQYPDSVIKAVDGHGGKEVFLTSDSFDVIQSTLKTSDFIIQPFVQEAKKDIRVYVIGKQIMGAVERTAKDGFKSNFSLGGTVRPYLLSNREKMLVNQVCDLFPFGMVGIDFLVQSDGEWLLNEIEDVVGARMYYQCYPHTNLLREYFLYVMERFRE